MIFQATQDQGMHQFDREKVNWLPVWKLVEYTPLCTVLFHKFFPFGSIVKFKPGFCLVQVLVIGAQLKLGLVNLFKVKGCACSMCEKSKSVCKSGFQNHQPYVELEDLQSEERLRLGLFFLEDVVKLSQKRLLSKIPSIQQPMAVTGD